MKTAIITGASSGMGAYVATALAERGWQVHAIARNFARDNLALHETVHLHSVSVTDEAALQSAVATACEGAKSIDLVFNNAGVHIPGTLEPSLDEFESLLRSNVIGAWNVARAVCPIFKRQGYGALISTSSVCGKVGFAGVGAYCASKFALLGLNESLFNELAPHGITVTALCPSWVNTPMAAHGPMTKELMIQSADILAAIDFILSLSPGACIKELEIQCRSDLC